MQTIVKTFKHNRKTICYIQQLNGTYYVKTGKPSNSNCLCWKYDNLQAAEFTANEYFNNYLKK